MCKGMEVDAKLDLETQDFRFKIAVSENKVLIEIPRFKSARKLLQVKIADSDLILLLQKMVNRKFQIYAKINWLPFVRLAPTPSILARIMLRQFS